MSILFRPLKDITTAPRPRGPRDLALHARLSSRLGRAIEIDDTLDYEDWTEPACLLDAALEMGLRVKILPPCALGDARAMPVFDLAGQECPDILLGRYLKTDAITASPDLAWPSPDMLTLPNHYGDLACFHNHAGRRTILANMPGDPGLAPERRMIGEVTPIDAGTAIAAFAGRSCLVKQVFPAKIMPPFRIDVPENTSPEQGKALFMKATGFHFARFEGDVGALLVQEIVEMTHETRIFVVDGAIACAAACIEDHTPLDSTGALLAPVFETIRGSGRIAVDPGAARTLLDAAHDIVGQIVAEAPMMRSFVLDLALGATGPLVIEMNPINAGLYGVCAGHLVRAILDAAGQQAG